MLLLNSTKKSYTFCIESQTARLDFTWATLEGLIQSVFDFEGIYLAQESG